MALVRADVAESVGEPKGYLCFLTSRPRVGSRPGSSSCAAATAVDFGGFGIVIINDFTLLNSGEFSAGAISRNRTIRGNVSLTRGRFFLGFNF